MKNVPVVPWKVLATTTNRDRTLNIIFGMSVLCRNSVVYANSMELAHPCAHIAWILIMLNMEMVLGKNRMLIVRYIYYSDVIKGAMASQITSLTIVYTTFYSGVDQRKHQSSASLAFVRGIHRGPVNSPHKWLVTRKMIPFDDVIMRISRCLLFCQVVVKVSANFYIHIHHKRLLFMTKQLF